jgi:hypothetical protein
MDEAGESPDQAARADPAAPEGQAAARGEADQPDSGFASTQSLGEQGPQPQADGEPAQHAAEDETAVRAKAQLARLQPGDWVDLRWRQQWRRAELMWVSDNGLLYLFASHGGQAHGMARHTLERLLRSRRLRPVEGGTLAQ